MALRCRDARNIDDSPHAEFDTPALKLECPTGLGCCARSQLRPPDRPGSHTRRLGTVLPPAHRAARESETHPASAVTCADAPTLPAPAGSPVSSSESSFAPDNDMRLCNRAHLSGAAQVGETAK